MLTGQALRNAAAGSEKKHLPVLQQLRKMQPHDVDALFEAAHENAFAEISCLDCANCCKTTPALLNDTDIKRIAAHLHLSQEQFRKQYVRMDEDGDTVINRSPCPFLLPDNACSIYAVRPFACKDYPHTQRKKMKQILDLTWENRSVCPAVLDIFDLLKDDLKNE